MANVQAACLASHFRTELSRLIVASVCRSVESLIVRILSLDREDGSLGAVVGAAVSLRDLFLDDFGWDIRA